jgi:hypothetical protein
MPLISGYQSSVISMLRFKNVTNRSLICVSRSQLNTQSVKNPKDHSWRDQEKPDSFRNEYDTNKQQDAPADQVEFGTGTIVHVGVH